MTLYGLAARNLRRNKARTALTIMGVAVAILTFVTLRTLTWAFTVAAEYAAKDRVVTRHKVTFIMPLPKRYIEDVRQANGVKVATWANWFGGKDPKNDREFFATFAVDADTYFSVFDEAVLDPATLTHWKEDRTGAIVGDVLARKLGWKVGDKVTLESSIFPSDPDKPWTFTIDGIYVATKKSVDRSTFIFHWNYFNDSVPAGMKDQLGWMIAKVGDPAKTADVGVQLDKIFDERDTQTLSQDEGSFNTSFLAGVSAVMRAVDIVSGVILLIMMLVLGNTIAMSVRERTAEYGVLRAMGFSPRQIALFIVGESFITAAIGGVVGVLLAYPFAEKGLGAWMEENMGNFFPYFRVPAATVAVALVFAVFLGIAAAVLPAYSASRLKVTDALRRVV